MIALLLALALQPQLNGPPAPDYVPSDAPMPETVATDPAAGVSLIKETCWDHLRDPMQLQAAAERGGFNFFWVGSRRERRVGTGTGTLNYSDAGLVNLRGSDRQCDIFMRIEPRDHEALATALTTALGLPAADSPSALPVSGWVSPTREALWTVRHGDGTTARVRLVSSSASRGGNVHFYVTLYPRAAPPPRRSRG
jgi:hypothetical protein